MIQDGGREEEQQKSFMPPISPEPPNHSPVGIAAMGPMQSRHSQGSETGTVRKAIRLFSHAY